MSECGSRKPPNGHVTTPIGAIHCFCWPSLSVDVFWKIFVFWKYLGVSTEFFYFLCLGISVTMSSQEKIKKDRGRVLFVDILWQNGTTTITVQNVGMI